MGGGCSTHSAALTGLLGQYTVMVNAIEDQVNVGRPNHEYRVMYVKWTSLQTNLAMISPRTCDLHFFANVMGVMKIGNIVHRAELEPTSLAFQASVLSLHHIGSLMSALFPCLPVYVALCLRGQCRPSMTSGLPMRQGHI